MWNDDSNVVRKVAAQTLGRTGRGKFVHDEILRRLRGHNVFDKVEALKRIHHLGIMTSKLIDPFAKCFKDDYITVRELACLAAQGMYEKDEKIIDALLFMARYDQVPKLKAMAIHSIRFNIFF